MDRRHGLRAAPIGWALWLAACPAAVVENPSGDCEAADDGGRRCYHAPEPGDQYLPDCDLPIDREYWRVFAQSEDSAYLIPRPDGAGLTWGICDGEDAELAALFDQYTLCAPQVDVALVNALPPADALAIAHALHERLVFTVVDLGRGAGAVEPAPIPTDLAEACAGPAAGDPALVDLCPELAAED